MAKKPRGAPRFKVGDTVEITSTIHRRFYGMYGIVVEVQRSRHSATLDKYTVRLYDKPDQDVFWEIELKSVDRILPL